MARKTKKSEGIDSLEVRSFTIKDIIKLEKELPNDQDLGREVRRAIRNFVKSFVTDANKKS